MTVLGTNAAEEGYELVALLFAAGASCCLDYQATDHTMCAWHYENRAHDLIVAYAKNIRAHEDYEGLECGRCGEWLPAYAKGGGQITSFSGINFCEECVYPI